MTSNELDILNAIIEDQAAVAVNFEKLQAASPELKDQIDTILNIQRLSRSETEKIIERIKESENEVDLDYDF